MVLLMRLLTTYSSIQVYTSELQMLYENYHVKTNKSWKIIQRLKEQHQRSYHEEGIDIIYLSIFTCISNDILKIYFHPV